jgi:hypothetical protein
VDIHTRGGSTRGSPPHFLPGQTYREQDSHMGPFPQLGVFLAVLLAVLALLVRYADVEIPVVGDYSFEALLVSFLILLAGVLFRGF